MKILPIQYTTNKINSFTGLWGKTSRSADFEETIGIPKIEETSYYYPFADETREEIDNVLNAHRKAYIIEEDGTARYKIYACKLGYTLPLKKVNYEDYANFTPNSKLTTNIKKVHFCVKDRYKTNEYDNQSLALNPVVSEKLQALNVQA